MRRLLVFAAGVAAILVVEEGFGHQIDLISYAFGVGFALTGTWRARA
ncbi:hypothetical protein [Mesorhizobium sp.]|nr:hypothetical protein [Mesorhizobium sp.]